MTEQQQPLGAFSVADALRKSDNYLAQARAAFDGLESTQEPPSLVKARFEKAMGKTGNDYAALDAEMKDPEAEAHRRLVRGGVGYVTAQLQHLQSQWDSLAPISRRTQQTAIIRELCAIDLCAPDQSELNAEYAAMQMKEAGVAQASIDALLEASDWLGKSAAKADWTQRIAGVLKGRQR